MALDVADGRRWPGFFDGQRRVGALEPYLAAVLVKLFGHAPAVVAIAPTLCFALFVAGQFLLWRRWADRPTAHLAALFAVAWQPAARALEHHPPGRLHRVARLGRADAVGLSGPDPDPTPASRAAQKCRPAGGSCWPSATS